MICGVVEEVGKPHFSLYTVTEGLSDKVLPVLRSGRAFPRDESRDGVFRVGSAE